MNSLNLRIFSSNINKASNNFNGNKMMLFAWVKKLRNLVISMIYHAISDQSRVDVFYWMDPAVENIVMLQKANLWGQIETTYITSATIVISAEGRVACFLTSRVEGYYLPKSNKTFSFLYTICRNISSILTWHHYGIVSTTRRAIVRFCSFCLLQNTDGSVKNLKSSLSDTINCSR